MPWLYTTDTSPPRLQTSAPFHTKACFLNSSSAKLPHLTSDGSAHMVNVSDKPVTHRRAIAIGYVLLRNPETSRLIKQSLIKKGDVLGTARLAGIMAAKNCSSIVPLCHPISLTNVNVELNLRDSKVNKHNGLVEVQAEVRCVGQTGVEMEALAAVMGALLTVIDMVKSVDKRAECNGIRIVLKEGGNSGMWLDKEWAGRQSESDGNAR
jgi:molybdenum cofactor biosynthesis protein MoaC